VSVIGPSLVPFSDRTHIRPLPPTVRTHAYPTISPSFSPRFPPPFPAPRSGLAWKKHIDVGAGVVDYDYRGPVGVVLFNHGTEDFGVSRGDRVAQLILERISMAAVVEVEEGGELPETKRGQGGFGSTGVRHQGQLAEREEGGNGEGKRMRVVEGGEAVEITRGGVGGAPWMERGRGMDGNGMHGGRPPAPLARSQCGTSGVAWSHP
jgi:hypothetical protein